MSTTTRPKTFTPEEAAALIRKASELHRSGSGEALSLEDVQRMAQELGVEPQAIQRALETRAGQEQARQERRKEVLRLIRHVIAYGVTLLGLTILNYLVGGGWWVQWVALGWGIGLAAHVFKVLRRSVAMALGE